jgi:hypothetical protein
MMRRIKQVPFFTCFGLALASRTFLQRIVAVGEKRYIYLPSVGSKIGFSGFAFHFVMLSAIFS